MREIMRELSTSPQRTLLRLLPGKSILQRNTVRESQESLLDWTDRALVS